MTEVKLLQISDTHMKFGDGGVINPVQAKNALERAVQHINAFEDRVGGLDAVIHTGDVADGGLAQEYADFNMLAVPLNAKMFAIPGNHDSREEMRSAGLAPSAAPVDGRIRCALDFGPVRALLLDSVVPHASHGLLGEEQIAWASDEIDAAAQAGRPALVFAHHPFFDSGVGYMDAIRMRDGDAFADMLDAKSNVALFACGHHHRMIIRSIGGAPAIAAPSAYGALELDFRDGCPPAPTAEQSAVLLHVWRPEPGPFGTVSTYYSAF